MHGYRSDPILRQKLLISLPCLRQKAFLYDPDSFRFAYKISAIKHRCNKCRPLIVNLYTPGAPNGNFRENICSEDDLRSRIFGLFVVKFLACLPLLGFSNPFLTDFDPKKGHLEFSGAFSWLKFSKS